MGLAKAGLIISYILTTVYAVLILTMDFWFGGMAVVDGVVVR